MYKLELRELSNWVREKRLKRILIQAPLGLRSLIPRVVDTLSSLGVESIISAGNCWGACDLAYGEAEAVEAEGLLHLGHARLLGFEKIPTFYLECRYADSEPILRIVDEAADLLDGCKKLGVGLTIQWMDFLSLLRRELEERGFGVYFGERGGRTAYPAHIIGCDYTPLWRLKEKVDCFLVVGSIFHGLGAALTLDKLVYAAEPLEGGIVNVERKAREIINSRYAWITSFQSAENVGVLVSKKPGQKRLSLARKLRRLLEESGRRSEIVITDEIDERLLSGLPYDAYVNTACPRLSIDDQRRFPWPLLLPSETLVALGLARWEKIIGSPRYLEMEVR